MTSVHSGQSILHYILEKRDSGQSSWETLTTLPPSVLECELDNLAPGKEYYIRIRAENQNGVSDAVETKEPIRAQTLHKGKQYCVVISLMMNMAN